MNRGHLFFLFLLLPLVLVSQTTFTIRGSISSAQNPVAYATFYIHETHQGTAANAQGNFELSGVKTGNYHIHVQAVGMEPYTQNISVPTDTILTITLTPTTLELDQLIIEAEHTKTNDQNFSLTPKIIGELALQKNSALTLSQSLEKIAGVQSVQVSNGIAKPVIRGLSAQRILVTQNGIKQEGQQWGTEHGLEIDPFLVGGIEVIKGPQSFLYGSDAMGGVIHLKNYSIPSKNSVEAFAKSSFQSVNQLFQNGIYAAANRNNWYLQVAGSHTNFGSLKVPADTFDYLGYKFPLYNNWVNNTGGTNTSTKLTVGVTGALGSSELTYTNYNQEVGFFPAAFGLPSTTVLQQYTTRKPAGFPMQRIKHQMLVWNNNIKLQENWLEIDAGIQQNNRTELEVANQTALQLLLNTYSAVARFHIETVHKFNPIFGVSWQQQNNAASGYEFLIPNYQQNQYSFFGFSEWTVHEKHTLNLGLNAAFGSTRIQELNPNNPIAFNRNYQALTGAIGYIHKPSKSRLYKWNLASSFRFPQVAELASNGLHHGAFRYELGSVDLQPERNFQLDFSLKHTQQKYQVEFTPFSTYFTNFIFLKPSGVFASAVHGGGQVYEYTQSQAFMGGYEFSLDYHFKPWWHLALLNDVALGVNLDEQRPLPLMPPIRAAVESSFEWDLGGPKRTVEVHVRAQYLAPQVLVERNEDTTPQSFTLNASVDYTTLLFKHNCTIQLIGENLLNTNYYYHLSNYRRIGIPQQGINLGVQLLYKLNKGG